MTKKHFQAILAKNQIAERLGEINVHREFTNADVGFLNSCLSDIEDFIGTGNQPNYADSWKTGRDKVENNPGYYGLGDTINSSWHIDDVKSLDDSLTDNEAREILKVIDHNHDATIGINWEVIQCHIDMYKTDKARVTA